MASEYFTDFSSSLLGEGKGWNVLNGDISLVNCISVSKLISHATPLFLLSGLAGTSVSTNEFQIFSYKFDDFSKNPLISFGFELTKIRKFLPIA